MCVFVAETSITNGRNTFINIGEERAGIVLKANLKTIPRFMLTQLGFKAAPQ